MKSKKVLSIVIPAFNMEKYIETTLDSMVVDDYMDKLEVLIIDDGSKDRTAELAQKYVDKYPGTFQLISKENGGHGSALNKGIELATGKYFRPIDADDWVDQEALKAVIDEMEKQDADMVLTNFRKILEKQDKIVNCRIKNVWNRREINEGKAKPKPGRDVLIYGKVYDFNEKLFDYSEQYLFHYVSYKTSLLQDNNIRFDEHVFYDDMEYDIFPLIYVKTVLPIDRYLYQYRLEREGQSVDESSFAKHNKHRRLIVEHICRYVIENKDKFGENVFNHIYPDLLWKITRQYDIYFKLMPNNRETYEEVLGFSENIRKISNDLYEKTLSKRVENTIKYGFKGFHLIANKRLQALHWNHIHKNDPDFSKKAWTIESDIPMHRMIRKRKWLKLLHISWLDPDMRRIRRFKNIHKGERVFITCPGPSLTIQDLELLKNEYTIGVNSITKAYTKTNWRPTYYALIDIFSFGKYLHEHEVDGGTFCQREAFLHYRSQPKTQNGRETYLLVDYSNHLDDWMEKKKIEYSDDISVGVYDGFTVTNMAIQIAIYMGFKKIYLIGCDCDYSKPKIHFIEAPGDKGKIEAGWLPQAAALSIDGYKAIRDFAYKRHVEIYNVTRGGKLEVFYRDNLERVLKER